MKKEKLIPIGKLSKRAQKEQYAARRSDWNGVKPVTRIIPNKKKVTDRRPVLIDMN